MSSTARARVFLTLTLLALTLSWDASGLDLAVMQTLGDSGGFPLRDNWLLSRALHDGVYRLVVTLYLAMLLMIWWPLGPLRRLERLDRVEIVCGLSLNLMLIGLLKVLSLSSCPWDLQEFGGVATYVSHWSWGMDDGGPGRCFPGGHVSAAFAWLALGLPWLRSGGQRQGWLWLGWVLLAGLLLGLSQTLRGAHYPSHTAWTALLCWLGAQVNHALFARWRDRAGARTGADGTSRLALDRIEC